MCAPSRARGGLIKIALDLDAVFLGCMVLHAGLCQRVMLRKPADGHFA